MPIVQENFLYRDIGPTMQIGFCAVGTEDDRDRIYWATGLIDTGTSHTSISKEIAIPCNLPIVGQNTVTHSNNTQSLIDVYQCSIIVLGKDGTRGIIRGVHVRETPLRHKNFQALVGRDFLALGSLCVDYTANKVTITIEPPPGLY
jgi:predicted aspartyl protease